LDSPTLTPTGQTTVAAEALADFRRRAADLLTYDDVMDATEASVQALGGRGFIYWTSPRAWVDARPRNEEFRREENMITARGPIFLKAFEALYLRRRGLVIDDPAVAHLFETTESFTTADVYDLSTMSRRERLNHTMMQRFGLHYDLFLPIHTPKRYQLLYVFALGKAAAVGERLLTNRPALEQLPWQVAAAIADHVHFSRLEKTETALSIREQECLNLMARGYTNRDIGAELGVRERTVKFHVDNVMRKMGATTRAQAVAIAARANWLTN